MEVHTDAYSDSVTGTNNKLNVSTPLTIDGSGTANQGALYSHTGINIYSGPITANGASIGVDADPNPTNGINYFINDYSLTIPGAPAGITAGSLLTKVDNGQLILPNAETKITAGWDIHAGWVTIANDNSLGATAANTSQNNQPVVTIESGAGLHLKPAQGSNLTITNNFAIAGMGVTAPSVSFVSTNLVGGIDTMGAIANLSGTNTLVGNVALDGTAGIGVERVFPDGSAFPTLKGDPSQLYLAGNISDGGGLTGGLTKLGSKLLVIQGQGTYSGPVDIKEGALLNENNTGLGTGTAGSPLIHDYEFKTTGAYTDSFGGPSMVNTGGSIAAGTGYSWGGYPAQIGNNQGLSLTGALPTPTNYTIQMDFEFNQIPPLNPTHYARILDYKNRTTDNGLYVLGGPPTTLNWYPTGVSGTYKWTAGTPVDLVIMRDAATKTLDAYINGVLDFTTVDNTNDAVENAANKLIFFIDDLTVNKDEIVGNDHGRQDLQPPADGG